MFDLSFTELLLIGVVALVVLGPERLPKVARMTGLWVRRARAQWYSVKAELERDLAAEELRRSMHDVQQGVQAMDQSLRDGHAELERELHQLGHEVQHHRPQGDPADPTAHDGDAASADWPAAEPPPAALPAADPLHDPSPAPPSGQPPHDRT